MLHTLRTYFTKIAPILESWIVSLFVVNATAYIFSAPILIWWGMPLSALSLIGNVVFAPALSVFIMLCTVLMCCSLLGISCTFLKTPLNITVEWWLALLKLGSKRFLYGQIAHPVILLLAIGVVLSTGYYIIRSSTRRMIAKTLSTGCICMTLLFALPLKNTESSLKNKNGILKVFQASSTSITLEDSGFLKGFKTPAKGIAFNVKRPIMQNHGTLHVKKLTTTVVSSRTFEAIAELIIAMEIQEIEIPQINPPQKPAVWRNLARLRKIAQENGTKICYTRGGYIPKLRLTPTNSSSTASRTSLVKSGHKTSKNLNSAYAA